nr:four helix bundle protein [uncultured bacterium]
MTEDYKTTLIRRTYRYALEILKLIDVLGKKDFSSEVLLKQLLRSATSIGANIIEAQAASSRKDFVNFLNHALKSANESKFWLGLLRDSGKADKEKINILLQETTELAKILGSSISTLKGKNKL